MNGKRGRPATGRNPLGPNGKYYVPDPNNFRKHLKKQSVERLITAFNYIHLMAFDRELSWSEKKNLKTVINEV